MTATAAGREALLEQAAIAAANAWAVACRVELAREGRRVEGGWPGTMPEARMRAGAEASRVLTARAMPALTHSELGLLTRITFDRARQSWRTGSRPPTAQ